MIRAFLSRLLAVLAVVLLLGSPAAARMPWQAQSAPALWKVEDADTTIYLFGTIHALPPEVRWFGGPVAKALGTADSFVTELPMNVVASPEAVDYIAARALLPKGQNLRDKLSAEQRSQFETALARIGMPPGAFDPVKPWFAGWQLALLPLQREGYEGRSGVEAQLHARLAPSVKRESLETLTAQIDMFDTMPSDRQLSYMMTVAQSIDRVRPTLDAVVAQWVRGKDREVARLLNSDNQDEELAERLLYSRNRAWAEWIRQRMATPGTVFVAVGAGHLAGARSVQAALEARGLEVERVQ